MFIVVEVLVEFGEVCDFVQFIIDMLMENVWFFAPEVVVEHCADDEHFGQVVVFAIG